MICDIVVIADNGRLSELRARGPIEIEDSQPCAGTVKELASMLLVLGLHGVRLIEIESRGDSRDGSWGVRSAFGVKH